MGYTTLLLLHFSEDKNVLDITRRQNASDARFTRLNRARRIHRLALLAHAGVGWRIVGKLFLSVRDAGFHLLRGLHRIRGNLHLTIRGGSK